MNVSMIQLPPNARFHIVGIGGAGMSAIATVLQERGYHVSGSDQADSVSWSSSANGPRM
jgi:UDP-N-acetylmuramate--alanine ligase